MARIRSIHPGLFTDEAFVMLTSDAQVFLMGLWTEADDQGVFEWKPVTLRMRLRPSRDGAVEPLLDEMITVNAIRQYEMGGKKLGAIRNFRKYQKPKSPNAIHPITDEIRNYVALTSTISETDEDDERPFPPNGEIPPQMEEGGGRGVEDEEEKKVDGAVADATRPTLDEEFSKFWEAYPRRHGANPKEPARKSFVAAIKGGAEPSTIIAGAKHCALKDHDKVGTEFIPRAVTWLQEKRWQDYQAPEPEQTVAGVYILRTDPRFEAWERATGKSYPTGKGGGYFFPTERPPEPEAIPPFLRRTS